MKKIYDISMSLENDMLIYPKDIPYERQMQRSFAKGDSSNVSCFTSTAHLGTHVDSPLHYVKDGYGVEAMPLDQLVGPADVLDCTGHASVTAKLIEPMLKDDTQRVLFKTDNSLDLKKNPKGPFNRAFVFVSGCAAKLCLERGIKSVAIDYLSIDESGNPAKSAHHILLENNIAIIEGVLLADIEPGRYFLSCLPLKMVGADGAPARAVLIEM
ncbi:MAG: cyclase family protein [Phycisphaerae bacterium]|nr:cyclase family protein [Phycisphaerae bacterium]